MNNTRRNPHERVSTFFLLAFGVAGLVVALADTFFDLSEVPFLKETSAMILLMVSFLTVAVALERVTQLGKMADGIDKVLTVHEESQCAYVAGVQEIRRIIERHLQVGLLTNYDDIYDRSEELIGEAEEIIRGTAFSAPSVPRDYVEAIAERAQAARERNAPIEYRVIVGIGASGVSREKRRFVETRQEAFARYGVSEYLSIGTITMPTGLDLLIVDDKHLIIAFPTLGVSPDLRCGLVFVNHAQLVSQIARWYDEHLWSARTPW